MSRASTDTALSPQLQAVYLACLRTRVRIAIDILSKHISQRQLERMMGMSQGYFSRLRAGAGNPSPELVSHLALLCDNAPRSLERLQRFWTLPDDEWITVPTIRPNRREVGDGHDQQTSRTNNA